MFIALSTLLAVLSHVLLSRQRQLTKRTATATVLSLLGEETVSEVEEDDSEFCHVVQEAAAKEEQWQKRADQREQDRLVREARKQRQQQVHVGMFQYMTSVQDSQAKLADSCLSVCLTASCLVR